MFVGQGIDVVDVEGWASPAGLAAVGGVVGKTDTGAQVAVAVGVGAVAELINLGKAVVCVVIVVGGIPNGGTADLDTPAAGVFTCDEQHFAQVARVGHGELFVFKSLSQHGGQLVDGFSGETAVVHIGEHVTVDA